MNICVAMLEMEENKWHFCHIMLYYLKKGKNTTEMQNKICAVYGEGAVSDWTCQSGLRSFVLEICPWLMLHGRVEQLKLTAIKQRINWEQSALHHTGESRHTHNIQINKVIGENEKCVFYFTEKSHRNFLATPML